MLTETPLEILVGEPSHVDAAWEIVRRCRDALRADQILQWDSVYPTRAVVDADAARGGLFVATMSGAFIATVAVDAVQDEQYLGVPWTTVEPALVVHRLCVEPAMQGRGIGRRMMSFIRDYAERQGFASIRLDAYSGNPAAVAMYRRMGFREAGSVHFPRRSLPFLLFEQPVAPHSAPST